MMAIPSRARARYLSTVLVAILFAGAAFAAGRWSAPAPSGVEAPSRAAGAGAPSEVRDPRAGAEKYSLMWTLRGDAVWVERNGDARMLVLKGPDRDVLWFADRPVRKSGRMTMARFTAVWDDVQFRDDPPNAAITVSEAGVRRDAVVELTSAAYDATHDTLRFACRCQVGDVDNSWLLATSPVRPITGDVAALVDPYETPTSGPSAFAPEPGTQHGPPPPAFTGFFDDIAQHAYCRLYWAPRPAGGLRGYRGEPSRVLGSEKWDTDEWTTQPSYTGTNPRGVGWGTWGVSETRSGPFRGCSHTVRLAMAKGYSFELTVNADYRMPATPQKGASTCTVIDPIGRRSDGRRDGRCQVADVDDMNGTGQSYVWELDTRFY